MPRTGSASAGKQDGSRLRLLTKNEAERAAFSRIVIVQAPKIMRPAGTLGPCLWHVTCSVSGQQKTPFFSALPIWKWTEQWAPNTTFRNPPRPAGRSIFRQNFIEKSGFPRSWQRSKPQSLCKTAKTLRRSGTRPGEERGRGDDLAVNNKLSRSPKILGNRTRHSFQVKSGIANSPIMFERGVESGVRA